MHSLPQTGAGTLPSLVRRLAVLALLVAFSPGLRAQLADLRVARVSTRDGLSQSIVLSMMQDRHGFLWLGTRDGLDRYDGYAFRSFRYDPFDTTSLSDYIVTAVAEDSAGYIWAGTAAGGINRLDRRTGRSQHFRYDASNVHSLNSDRVNAVGVDRRGCVWVETEHGLHRFDAERGRFERIPHVARRPKRQLDTVAMYIDRNGELWSCTSGVRDGEPHSAEVVAGRCVVGRFDPVARAFRNWEIPIVPGAVRIIGDHRDGSIDLAPYGASFRSQPLVYRLDPRTGHVRHFSIAAAQSAQVGPGMNITPSAVEHDSICWYVAANISTVNGSRSRWKLYRDRLVPLASPARAPTAPARHVEPTYILTTDLVRNLFVDRMSTYWIPTAAGVAAVTRIGAGITTWRHDRADTSTLSADRIRGLEFDRQGILWAGTDVGLNRYDPGTGRWVRYYATTSENGGLRSNVINVIYRDRDSCLLLGTHVGVARIDGMGQPMPLPLPGVPADRRSEIHVWSILRDRSNDLWIGTGLQGLVRVAGDGRHHRRYVYRPDDSSSLTDGGIWCLLEDRHGVIWVGTDEGLCRYRPGTDDFRRYVHEPGNRRSIAGKRIWSLYEDSDGELWICSYGGGISRYDRATDDFTTITARDGLVTNSVVGMLEDDSHDFWIGTTRGLVRWDRRAGTFRLYDEHDGLQGNEFTFKAFTKGSDGRLYFGGVAGISALKPQSLIGDSFVPPVVITRFRIYDSLAYSELFDGDVVHLRYDENYFSIEFAALDFINSRKNRYRYRLTGIDRGWIETGSDNRIASYTHLEPGSYRFRVLGCNADGVWNRVGATLTIVIAPPWWGTWAFRSAAAVALGVVLVGGYRRRMSNIRRVECERQERVLAAALESQEAERQRIARDLHDGVGQVLAAVVLNLERVQDLCAGYHRGPNPLEAPLQRSMDVLKGAIGEVRTISHGLGTSTLRELGLVAAISELLDNLATDATTFEFVTAGLGQRPTLPVEICLFRAAQELIANIVHHAGATEGTIQIVRNEREARLTVEDNGRGFIVAGPRGGMGLENVCARAAALHGEVHVDSAPGHGTTVTVVLPTAHDMS